MSAKQFTSVWTREPRKTTSPGRTREVIVQAAVELLDEEGLDGLSMRKLGAKLSAGATSLYWYVANKDELLELAYDEMWGELKVPDPEEVGWREAASVLAYSMRQAMLRHPWAASLVGRLPALGPNAIQTAGRMREVFAAAGFKGMDVDYAVNTLNSYVFGITLPEIAFNKAMAGHEYDPEHMRTMVRRAARDFPDMLERVNMDAYDNPDTVRAVAFDFGLLSVLDGLERRLTT
ncbi:TetR/AcrR family transcriptional regulator C-terminal domain-containing protein [Nonomuraea sp. SYSU D8015]|uniref:TetR/AcrR family transcriptional regulator C-terminal domain-containing protein n=1 Tax=Nonomuraea sp. SYSU D8015 TaxID=2593644 RepID=UPI001661169C|nr:TetR/AcrR family transcriptional regulator C-terminal domain-containing protein [Nonomuraea sp. SYSU D8015]